MCAVSGIVDSQWQSMCRAIPYGEYAEIMWRRDAHQELGARRAFQYARR